MDTGEQRDRLRLRPRRLYAAWMDAVLLLQSLRRVNGAVKILQPGRLAAHAAGNMPWL